MRKDSACACEEGDAAVIARSSGGKDVREGSEGEVNVVREREREKREVAAAVSQ